MTAKNSKKTAKRIPGRPFKKGESGNPGGRPKTPELFKEKTLEAQKKIIELMDSDDEKIALQAAQLILAYSLGKPTEHHELGMSESLEQILGMSR